MDRCLIVFDLDTKLLEQRYHNASWRNGYADIQRVLYRHKFANIQGTVYLRMALLRFKRLLFVFHGLISALRMFSSTTWLMTSMHSSSLMELLKREKPLSAESLL
jgi:virulence-associated protein VapD